MVARTTPIGVKLKPDPPESDAERLRTLADGMRRRLGAIDATRHNLEQLLRSAEEVVEILDRQEREAA